MGRSSRLAPALCAALLSVGLTIGDARAQANDSAAAQALFNDGKRLMTAGQYAAACPKFAESQRLDPGIGTMLWLADCNAKNGQIASAWALFNDAESLASKTKDPRATLARDEAKKLEPRLSKLVIDTGSAGSVSGLEVKRDGVVLGKPLWGAAIPTDPGQHRITVTAPDKKPWETEVTVPREGGSVVVKVPVLEAAPAAPPPPPPPPVKEPTPEAPPPDPTKGRTQRVIGFSLVVVGVASAAVGTYFGLRVGSKNDESKPFCNGNTCSQAGYDARSDALTAATISDVTFIVAGAAVVGGAVLYFTAPRARTSAAAAPLAGGGAAAFVTGTF